MEPINGVNAQNYAVAAPQGQNNQVQDTQDYSSMPMVYEPEIEEKKKASSNMLGMTALGALAVVGIGYGIHKGKKVNGLKQEIAQLSAEKESAEKLKDEATKALNKERTLSVKERFIRFFNPEYGMTKEEIEARKAALDAKEKAAKEAKEAKKAKKADDKKADNKADDVNKEENK